MTNLRIAELDFDTIKTNLKTFLQAQNEFTDYDFEGSGLSILLDVLAYNTHYNAYLANMLANEMFLDSAVKRSSVVSIAKHLGYTPRSTIGSSARLNITVNNPTGTPTSLTLNRYSSFTTLIDGTSFTFLNTEPVTIQPVSGVYTFNNVTVKEGRLLEFSYVTVNPGTEEKYEIPNAGIDTTTMLVTVQNSSTDNTLNTFILATDITAVTNSSNVYFLEENTLGNYEIYFGDGILGKKLTPGNIIRIQYLVSAGSVSNVSGLISQSFTADNTIGGSSNINITVVSNSNGGAEIENINSIKFNAPRSNLSKNRAVTKSDYAAIIKEEYPQVEAISVWGGEENEPPVYGKVFISLKPFTGFTIDDDITTDIKNNILKNRQVLTVTPEFVDPDLIFANFIININFNKNLTTLTASQLSNLARTAVNTFFNSELQQFEKPFFFSQLVETLNNINDSILSVLIELKLQKRIDPALNAANAFTNTNTLRFSNSLQPGELQSTRFFIEDAGVTLTARLRDEPNTTDPDNIITGSVRLFNFETDADLGEVGTIDYTSGDVTITSITPVGFPENQFDISITCGVRESNYNLRALKNQIIVLDDNTEFVSTSRLPGLTINVAVFEPRRTGGSSTAASPSAPPSGGSSGGGGGGSGGSGGGGGSY